MAKSFERRHKTIFFGDGATGVLVNQQGGIFSKETGEEMVKCWIIPTTPTIEHYNLEQRGLLVYGDYLIRTYPKAKFITLNDSSAMATVLCTTDLFGNSNTVLENMYPMLNTINMLDIRNKSLNAHNIVLQQRMNKILNQEKMYWEETVNTMRLIRSASIDVKNAGADESIEEGSYDDAP